MANNHVTWSRKPSSENVSEVFIYSNYDSLTEDDKQMLPSMLAVYSETMESVGKYERRKRMFFILGIIAILGAWFYLAVSTNV